MRTAREAIEQELGRRIQVESAGKIVVERDGRSLLMMFPDGEVVRCRSKRDVMRRISTRNDLEARRRGVDALVTIIEWR